MTEYSEIEMLFDTMKSFLRKFRLKKFAPAGSFAKIYPSCKDFTMTSVERMKALHKATVYISEYHVPGDLVECGVWKGGSAMMMATTLVAHRDISRNIFLYDTYAGMTKPEAKDREISTGKLAMEKWKRNERGEYNNWCYAALKMVKLNMNKTKYPPERIRFVKGGVESTIPKISPEKISLLRLDTDWFASTYHELRYLYPLLVSGGILIVDDYGHWTGAKKAVDKYFREQKLPFDFEKIDYSGLIGVKK